MGAVANKSLVVDKQHFIRYQGHNYSPVPQLQYDSRDFIEVCLKIASLPPEDFYPLKKVIMKEY